MGAVLAFLFNSKPNQYVTLRYVTTGNFTNNNGYVYSGTVFWATNHTDRQLHVSLKALEFYNGSNWVSRSNLWKELDVHAVTAARTMFQLDGHEAGYSSVDLPAWMAPSTWRARFTVVERLRGVAGIPKRVEMYRSLRNLPPNLLPSGPGIRVLNPFAKDSSVYGRETEVASQEVSEN